MDDFWEWWRGLKLSIKLVALPFCLRRRDTLTRVVVIILAILIVYFSVQDFKKSQYIQNLKEAREIEDSRREVYEREYAGR